MRILFIFLLLTQAICSPAQSLFKSILTYGDFQWGFSMLPNRNGGYNSFTKSYDLKNFRLDTSGNIVWAKRTHITGVNLINSIVADALSDSTFIIATTNDPLVALPFQFYIILAKVNDTGQVLWAKSVESKHHSVRIQNIKHTSDGGFILVGSRSDSFTVSTYVYFKSYVAKVDSSGVIQWSKCFGRGAGTDIAHDIIETNGGFLITGTTDSGAAPTAFLMKTDKYGNTVWCKRYPFSLGQARTIIKDGNAFLLAGCTASEPDAIDTCSAIISKTDSAGNLLWTKRYDFGKKAELDKVIKTRDGAYLLLGTLGFVATRDSRCFLLKIDSTGNMQWCKKYGGDAVEYSGDILMQKPSGGFVAMGDYSTDEGVLFMLATDSAGNGPGKCEVDVSPNVYSAAVGDFNFTFAEQFLHDTAFSIGFTVMHDSMISLDTCSYGFNRVENIEPLSFDLYPNPSSGVIHIESMSHDYEIDIIDTRGSIVLSQKVSNYKCTLDMAKYPRGFYMIRMRTPDNLLKTQGFILQ